VFVLQLVVRNEKAVSLSYKSLVLTDSVTYAIFMRIDHFYFRHTFHQLVAT